MGSGYDLTNKNPFRLMKGRLGAYEPQRFQSERTDLEGLHLNYEKFQTFGGNSVQERMIKRKRRSLDYAIWNSYQSAEIVKTDATDKTPVRALINPNRLNQDYDCKTLDVGFEYNIQCGDVFEWIGTHTYWIVYLQELTELAFFRGSIRRCSYQISWETENGKQTVYAALTGPKQGGLPTSTPHGISIDTPNYSIDFLVPQTEETRKFFRRYTKFYLKDCDTCWRIEGVDTLSNPGIIEVYAKEYYVNKDKDDVDNGIVDGLIEELVPNTKEEEMTIRGETFIKVKQTANYLFDGNIAASWTVDKKVPVQLEVDSKDPRRVSVKWTSSYSGQFELHYGNFSKTIIVESLF